MRVRVRRQASRGEGFGQEKHPVRVRVRLGVRNKSGLGLGPGSMPGGFLAGDYGELKGYGGYLRGTHEEYTYEGLYTGVHKVV